MKFSVMATRSATTALLVVSAQLAMVAPATADAVEANLWSRLWRTPDQRGQALLQQGDAATAAQAFADPERKAHAELQAKNYTAAAQTLTGIDTAEAHYNRGNALAHTGDLQGAIRAYDAAIKQNSKHADARHNRDIVVAALQKQKEDKKDESKQDKQQSDQQNAKADDKSGGKQDGKDGKPDAKTGDKSDGKQDGKDGKSGAKPDDKADGKQGDKGGKPDAKTADEKAGQAKDSSGSKAEDKPGQKPSAQPNSSPSAKPSGEPASGSPSTNKSPPAAGAANLKDDAAQARRDAESALGKASQPPNPGQNGASASTKNGVEASAPTKLPLTEKQIAQEQWLRAIPDDPGGLLRRKFLIEHMLRQQGQKP